MELGDYIYHPTGPEGTVTAFHGDSIVKVLTPLGEVKYHPIAGYRIKTATPDALFIAERAARLRRYH